MARKVVRGMRPEVMAGLKAREKQRGRSVPAERKDSRQHPSLQSGHEARTLALRIRRQLAGRRHGDGADLLTEDRAR